MFVFYPLLCECFYMFWFLDFQKWNPYVRLTLNAVSIQLL